MEGIFEEKATGEAGGEEDRPTKHKTNRARYWPGELTFGTFNIRIATVNGTDGIGHIDTLL